VYRVLSHDGKLAQGLNPFLTIADEAHIYPGARTDPTTSELWEAMAQGGGARDESLLLAITTAGNNLESLLGRLYKYGEKVAKGVEDDPTFGMAWWAAPDGVDHRDERFWHIANPNLALGLASMEDMRSAVRTTPEAVFRRYRLNQFIHGGGIGWMDMEAWVKQADPGWHPKPGERVVMGFDGSVSDDATALVGMTVEDPHLFVIGMWQKPEQAPDDWQVPRAEVHAAVEDAFEVWDVRMFQLDDAFWEAEYRQWQNKYGKKRVIDFTMSNARMVPAAQELYAGITSGQVKHSDDPRLNQHVANAIAHQVPSGTTIKKDAPHSPRKIDLAVAGCMANDARLRLPVRRGPSVAGF
jgi:phage terminase large subunit-like protein